MSLPRWIIKATRKFAEQLTRHAAGSARTRGKTYYASRVRVCPAAGQPLTTPAVGSNGYRAPTWKTSPPLTPPTAPSAPAPTSLSGPGCQSKDGCPVRMPGGT